MGKRKEVKKIIVIFIMSLSLSLSNAEELIIFHAGSLSSPFSVLEMEFENENLGVDVFREASGSVMAIRKIKELGKPADIIAVSDIDLITKMLYPDFITSYTGFATNRMVIAFKEGSRYGDVITSENWYELITIGDVRIGRADPNNDPCGYRTLLLWKLAERYYKIPNLYDKLLSSAEERFIRSKETDLISLQEAGEIDYHFQYESVAKENNFKYILLPPEIDLSDLNLFPLYSSVSVEIRGKTPKERIKINGSPIIYGIGILKVTKNSELALKFLRFLFSKRGESILRNKGLTPLFPPIVFGVSEGT